MNFTIKVKLTASSKLLDAIKLLTGGVSFQSPEALTPLTVVEPVYGKKVDPEPVAEKATRTRKPKEEVKEEAPAIIPAVIEEPVKDKFEEQETANEPVTVETVRAAVQAQAQGGKRDQVKTLLTKYEVARVTDLPETKYSKFLEEVNAL